jgi:hypothetical protein
MLSDMYERPDFRPQQDALWDMRDAILTEFSTEEVRQIAALVAANWGHTSSSRAAMVVSRKVDFGMVRMYEMQLTPDTEGRTQVFTDIDEAWAWLRAPTHEPERR